MLNLQSFFSVLDDYNNFYEKKDEQGSYHYMFEISSKTMKSKNIVFFPNRNQVFVVIEWYEDKQCEITVKSIRTEMYVDPEDNEKLTPCPICNCKPEDMELIESEDEDDYCLQYNHNCGFTAESVQNVLSEVNQVDWIKFMEGYPKIELDYIDGKEIGFSEDGSYFCFIDDKAYHYHFHEEDIYCPFCSRNEPIIDKEGISYQFCPVLTKEKEKILEKLEGCEPRYSR